MRIDLDGSIRSSGTKMRRSRVPQDGSRGAKIGSKMGIEYAIKCTSYLGEGSKEGTQKDMKMYPFDRTFTYRTELRCALPE